VVWEGRSRKAPPYPDFTTRYTYHAQMEPMNATAAVTPDGKSAEIWAGTQNVSGLFNDVAKLLQTERSKITFHQHVIGGGYGRRGGPQDVVLDAVRLAKTVGSPVKVIWSREDDVATGKVRPILRIISRPASTPVAS
jgi:isoquinoline 1-oxidoreductase subunit beta